ncbi:MAG TPA: alkaline phosphatase D family protein [Saprospiraceae bacterium]|nr:alkaline phosphatase D family protein [Saprospiraceae bacterium]
MKKSLHLLLFLLCGVSSFSQIISGPMLGSTELRTAKIWVETKPNSNVSLWYWPKSAPNNVHKAFETTYKKYDFQVIHYDLVALEPGTVYEYELRVGKKILPDQYKGTVTTSELWQWRKPAPDFSFLAGSCAYINDSLYDRPGEKYGTDNVIFQTMAKEKAEAMIWLGDAWYYREADLGSEYGMWYRASHDRQIPNMQKFLKSMKHYAIWDDHEYGPNNDGVSFIFKDITREVFKSYFLNPSYGEYGKGIYTKVSLNDVDLFFLDNRTWRSSDYMNSKIDEKVNQDKIMLGEQQMTWLKSALLNSNAPFKLIVIGSQVLNTSSSVDCFCEYEKEYNELLDFIEREKVRGILFVTGDRHHSEIITKQRESTYPLYDITISPLTSGIGYVSPKERENPNRVANTLLESYNYGKFSISGEYNNRRLKVEFIDAQGNSRVNWSIHQNDLRTPK